MLPAVKGMIREHSSYELPEVFAAGVKGGSAEYLA